MQDVIILIKIDLTLNNWNNECERVSDNSVLNIIWKLPL